MIFKLFRHQKPDSRYLRVRVESCVDTVLELNKRLGEGKIRIDIIRQFEKLKESIRYLTDESVDEKDINKIEEATNQLLAELKVHCGKDNSCSLTMEQLH